MLKSTAAQSDRRILETDENSILLTHLYIIRSRAISWLGTEPSIKWRGVKST